MRPLPAALPDRRRTLGLDVPALDDDQTSWLVTFSDLVLQLFAFVLVSVALAGEARTPEPMGPPPPPAASACPETASSPVMALEPVPAAPEKDDRTPPPEAAVARADTPGDANDRLAAAARSLRELVAAEGGDGVQVTVRDSDLIVTLSDTITFGSGSAELLPEAAPILRRIGVLAQAMPDLDLEVDGHTDDVPVRGAFASNLELSLARAARVVHELASAAPDVAARAIAAGFGEHRPVASNADETGRARNRRVEIRLVPRAHA